MTGYSGIACFWADSLELATVSLRRYKSADGEPDCTGPWSYHNAHGSELAQVALVWTEHEDEAHRSWSVDFPEPPHDDPRWPLTCDHCDYAFVDDDHWQVFSDRLYRRPDTGVELVLRGPNGEGGQGPPGMLFDMAWYPRPGLPETADGLVLGAVCPNGAIWCVDGPATGGGGWTRSGDPRSDPPSVTAQPSIVAGDYHGFLTNGRFTDG